MLVPRTSADGTPITSEVFAALKHCRPALMRVGVFSACINVLSLTGSLYMLQVSDRVLASRSVATLVGLSLLAFAAYLLHGALDSLRCRMLGRIGVKFGSLLIERVYETVTALTLKGTRPAVTTQGVRDLDQVQKFLSGNGPTALFDMPFLPLFLFISYLMHPMFGWLILAGGLVIIGLSVLMELRTRGPATASVVSGAVRHAIVDTSSRNAEALKAMGMNRTFAESFAASSARHADHQLKASDAASGIGSMAKVFRGMLQSAVLGLGAYLAINGEVTAGAMIAASILTARALAPIEIAVAHWRQFIAARQGFLRLITLLGEVGAQEPRTALPKPQSRLAVEGLQVIPPGQTRPVVQHISFELKAGQGLAIIGPSASGKSTLARALIGVWPAARGRVCLDGASIDHWDAGRLGQHVGYLPQNIELFDGTIAENISRFDRNADSQDIIRAAQDAGAHEMILRMAQGYETRIGDGGNALSAGQRQRVALARALYGDPFFVVLDEPNSNLDAEGEDALADAMRSIRERGGIVIVVTHRPTALASVDLVGVMIEGRLRAFGRKEDIMKRMGRQPATPLAGRGQPATQAV